MSLKLVCFIALFSSTISLLHGQKICRCENQESSWVWASWTSVSFSECNCHSGQRSRYIRCDQTDAETGETIGSEVCQFIVNCTNILTCIPTWTTWSNIGDCEPDCGARKIKQHRICQVTPNERSTSCNPATRAEIELREVACTIACPITTMISHIQTKDIYFDSTINFSSTRNLHLVLVTERDSNHTRKGTEANELLQEVNTTQLEPQMGTIVLVAVFGSVGLICLTVIMIAAVIITRKRSSQQGRNRNLSSAMAFANNGDYETVGPPLPDRPSTQNTLLYRGPDLVSNSLYEPMLERDTRGFDGEAKTSENAYLQPIVGQIPLKDESTYFTINHLTDI